MPVLQQASNWSRFASVNKTNLRNNFYMLKKPKSKAINIKETTTPTQGTLYFIRAAHLLSILSSDKKRTAWEALNSSLRLVRYSPIRKQSHRGKDSQPESRFGVVLVNCRSS